MSDSLDQFDDAADDNAALEAAEQQQRQEQHEEPPAPLAVPPEPGPADENLDGLLRELSGDPVAPQAPVADPAQENAPAAPKVPGEVEGQTVPFDRFKEVNDENKRLKELDHARHMAALREQENNAPDPLEGINPAVADLINRVAGAREKKLMGDLAPLISFANEELGKRRLTEEVPGYNEEIHTAAQALYDSMPPEKQAMFNGSEAGTIALTALAALHQKGSAPQGDQAPTPPAPRASGNPNTAHSLNRAQGIQAPPARQVNPMTMPKDKFDKLLERVRSVAAGNTPGQVDGPDSFLD